jgi:hypothetical protein
MAEETKTVVETTETNATENIVVNEPIVDTVSKTEYEKLKSALDKALKEKGDITKQLRAKQSEDERFQAEQAEAQRIRDEEYEAIKAENARMKAFGAYKDVFDEKVVEKLIVAVSEADHNAIAEIIDKEIKSAVKIAETTWMKSRPSIGANSYSSMTVEQIMAIKDREERQRAIAMNLDLFK